MAASDETEGFRRVLIALDSAASGGAALETAAVVAAAHACELSGLFIEDENLLRLAGLPFAREIQLARPASRALVPGQLLQDLRAQASLARAAMARQAAQHRIAWSFEVTQGRSEDAVLLAAARGDIIALSRGFGALGRGRISQRLRLIAARAPGPILLMSESLRRQRGPVLLPYDASPAAESMLAIASGLARALGEPLEILLLGPAVGQEAAVEARLRASAGKKPLPLLHFATARGSAHALRRLCEADRGLLVLPTDADIFAPGDVERVMERARLPIVLQGGLRQAGA